MLAGATGTADYTDSGSTTATTSVTMPQLTDEHTSLIGRESPPRPAPYAINEAMARFWCEMVEDPNPIYFEEAYARGTWLKEPFAPPAMLFTWGMQPVWPEEDRHESMISRLQFPGCSATLAVNATQEYAQPLRYGDSLTVTNQIASIGEEKTTRLGTGHFVVMLDTFRNQRGDVAGTHSFTLFMYAPATAADRESYGRGLTSVRQRSDVANDTPDPGRHRFARSAFPSPCAGPPKRSRAHATITPSTTTRNSPARTAPRASSSTRCSSRPSPAAAPPNGSATTPSFAASRSRCAARTTSVARLPSKLARRSGARRTDAASSRPTARS